MDKLILLTGASGFVGSNLTPYLEDHGYTVHGFSRSLEEHGLYAYKNLTISALDKAAVCIHLAGKAHDLSNNVRYEDYKKANVESTKKLFDMFLKSSCSKFIFVSSVKAVADTTDVPLTEDMVSNPTTFYGISKHEAENYILSKNVSEEKKIYILRPCMIHGPGNKGNLNMLYNFVKKGLPFPFGAFQNKRSFLSIENFNFVAEKCCNQKLSSGIYHLADAEAISTNELLRLIAETLGKKPKIISIPKSIIHFGATLGSVLSLPFSKHRVQKITENYVVDTTKLTTELQQELPITIREGLRQTIKSFAK